MDEVGLFEAKNKLSELVDRAERGEEVVITRRGKAVAKLVPAVELSREQRSRHAAQRIRKRALQAAQDIRNLAQEMNLGPFDWDEWKKYRDAGRK
jgi:prevent-host-death family protein